MIRGKRAIFALFSGLLVATTVSPLRAERTIRILEQFGISYLPLHVIKDQNLIAKHGKTLGVDIKTEWTKVSGGAAANDALLSGAVDIVTAGLGPLLTIWDRTKGNEDVRGIAALADVNFALLTSNPKVSSLEDFGPNDRIAVPSIRVSVQARALQLAAAKTFGREQFAKFDPITVSLPHPDATQALISKNGTVTAHFSNAPYQQQALNVPGVRRITDWFAILGGPTTSVTLYTRAKYRSSSPKTYRAFIAALDEAITFVNEKPEAAVDTYVRVEQSKLDKDFLLTILKSPDLKFGATPHNTLAFAQFLKGIGALKNTPSDWRDYFFEDVHERKGS